MFKIKFLATVLAVWTSICGAQAQDLQALARVNVAESLIEDVWGSNVEMRLALSQPVPYRVLVMGNPVRIVLDFKEIDWQGFDPTAIQTSERIKSVRFGLYQPGWSRMVLELDGPMVVDKTAMEVDKVSRKGALYLKLRDASTKEFELETAKARLIAQDWSLPEIQQGEAPKTRQQGNRPIVVVLDPGHGGIDPGAEFMGFLEKDLTLQFAFELKEALIRTGRFKAEMTREEDVFISLPRRIARARNLGADVFISLHADAVLEGSASGTTVYTLSEKASNSAARSLAAQLDRADLLSGVDLRHQDDELAGVLMDMARVETQARSEMLADMVVSGISQSIGKLRKRPHLNAAFSVLRAPDIPSILIELGFMNNRTDLVNLTSVPWRKAVIEGMVIALDSWAVEDAAQAKLLRQ